MPSNRRSWQTARAFSLVEMMIGMGLVALATGVVASMYSAQFRGQRSVELKSGRSDLAAQLLGSLDCQRSVVANFPNPAALAAADGQLVPLFDSKNAVIVSANPANPTRIGDFTVRAIAHTVVPPLGFEIQVARPRGTNPEPLSSLQPDALFERDPATSAVQRWGTKDSRLFPQGAYPCAARFVAGCAFECPVGSVIRAVGDQNGCVQCANVTCPLGQNLRGIDANGNPLCQPPPPNCPPEHVLVGSTCVHETNDLVHRVRKDMELECRVQSNTSPSPGGSVIQCNSDEFVAAAGGQCVDSFGDVHWGIHGVNTTGHNPAGLNLRFPGYLHTNWPISTHQFRADCYYNPADKHQGHTVGTGVCCKKKLVYSPSP